MNLKPPLVYLLFACSIFYSCSSSPTISKNSEDFILSEYDDYNLLKLKGKVKSVILRTYSANDSLINLCSYKFNRLGQTIEHKPNSLYNDIKIEYEYDKKGVLVKKVTWENNEKVFEDNVLDSFNIKGKVTKRIRLNLQDKVTSETIFTYSSKDLLVKRESLLLDDHGKWTEEYAYHENDALKNEVHSEYDSGGVLIQSIVNTYNEQNQVLSKTSLGKFSDSQEIFVYNSFSNLVKHTVFSSSDSSYLKESIIQYDTSNIKTDSIFSFYNDKISMIPSNSQHFKFNNKGKIEQYIYKIKDTISSVISYSYDGGFLSEKNCIYSTGFTKIRFDRNEIEIFRRDYKHQEGVIFTKELLLVYDDNLNIIKGLSFINDTLETRHEIFFEYY